MKSIAQAIPHAGQMNGSFEVAFPLGVTLRFAGAPFRNGNGLDGDVLRVKCATEQPGRCDVAVPCEDFGTPTHETMLEGVERAIEAAFDGKLVFAGCAGGIGRTGTFLSVVLKVLQPGLSAGEIVPLIRKIYLRGAVETQGQQKLIREIDVRRLQKRVKWLWLRAVFRRVTGR